ncbi:low temperature requirement protein A [Pengzhenrongella phosphoraccumulans]|uniref:low temperature requirement protein A n=1 Tax=Pengzhenrongella phosphoraccumulans TaxID=3114394 RepID=UPI003890ECDA
MTPRRNPAAPCLSRPELRTDDDQGATYVELFFDLVFVYAVTQVVDLIHGDLTAQGLVRGLLAFWLVWWAWTQFTWALNTADTRHRVVELATLIATAVAFLMAYALPTAFDDGQGLWFVVPYVAVRLVGLWLYLAISGSDPHQRSAVTKFATLSLIGLAIALVGGALDTPARSWAWLAVIVADLVAGAVAGRSEGWNLRAGHFAERYGLFVIIALGESLIAVGVTASDVDRTGALVIVMVLGVVIAAELWWTYFAWVHAAIEHAIDRVTGATQSAMARDAFSFVHFVVVFAIVGVAVGLEGAIAHPYDPIEPADLAFLVGGAAAFLLATALALWRTTGEVLWARVGITVVFGTSCVLAASVPAAWILALIAAGIASVIVAERQRGVAPSPL